MDVAGGFVVMTAGAGWLRVMDVAGGFVLVAALVAVLWLVAVGAGWLRMWVLDRRGRAWRRVQVRKADRWRCDVGEQAALVAMRRVADDIDREDA